MSEDILDEEKIQEEMNTQYQENMEEAAEQVEETIEEIEEPEAEVTVTKEGETEKPEKSKSKLPLYIAVAVAVLALLGVCGYLIFQNVGKYKGYKKDKSGIYYKFHDEIHTDAEMPKTGDLVGILFSLRTEDSTLIPMIPNEMLMDSVGVNDFFAAIRMMHVGDSATFIFNGQEFFDQMMEGQEYPFGDEPLYADVKLYGHMPKAEFEKAKAAYEAELDQRKNAEQDSIAAYVAKNKMGEPTPEGLYIKTIKKGSGPLLQDGQEVTVHYVGKLLDGTEFDSSIGRNEPFTFVLGNHQVIPGWELALSKMHVGEQAIVLIPSVMGYGERGAGNMIDPYTPLVFDIRVLSAKNSDAAAE